MIKAVFVDIDNTLLDFNACAAEAMEKTMREFSLRYDPAMFPVFRRINDSLWRKIELGEITKDELYDVRWDMIFRELGIRVSGADFEARFLKLLEFGAQPVPGAGELIAYLGGRYTVCAASNAPHEQQLVRLEKAGMLQHIHAVFTSEKIGFSKPDKRFFDACFASLPEISPAETMMIGDSPTADIQGAAACGMRTCWLNSAEEPMPSDLSADYVVGDLAEIMKIL